MPLRLSAPVECIRSHYRIVVVGSGYGGAVAASRLARAGQSVCLLERGREFWPGDYPDTMWRAMRQMQVDLPGFHLGPPTGLYDFRVNRDISAFVGCGLGGTSLVNANVALRVDRAVLSDPRWPAALRGDPEGSLDAGYRRATAMLGSTAYPETLCTPRKLRALEVSASSITRRFYRPPINVTFEDRVNRAGVHQHACTGCGDCVSGCNVGAKNTVLMNYLPDAREYGAEIFTEVRVERIAWQNGRWLVYYRATQGKGEKTDDPPMFVSAEVVILAAGVLGTTEILLRSRESLDLSDKLGHRFTGNGDVLAFGYNSERIINGIGFGRRPFRTGEPVGPCITGVIDTRDEPVADDRMVIEEGAIPSALSSRVLSVLFALAAALVGMQPGRGLVASLRAIVRVVASILRGAYHGALRRTQTYLVMSQDDGEGQLSLRDGRLRIEWPKVGQQAVFQRIAKRLRDANRPLGGTFVRDPIWTRLFDYSLITVHPQGGCVMADDAKHGVVNDRGQVFSGRSGQDSYPGLYVMDGSVIPCPIGVNPLLTISALAERNSELLARDRGWTSEAPPRVVTVRSEEPCPGIRFRERLSGWFISAVPGPEPDTLKPDAPDRSAFKCILTIVSDDLDQMVKDRRHQASCIGTVNAPDLSREPLTVTGGKFNFFEPDPDEIDTRYMRYQMKLAAAEGPTYYFEGVKVIRDDPGFDIWSDTTTVYYTVYNGHDSTGRVRGRGVLRITLGDFLREVHTLEITNASGWLARLRALVRFARFFLRNLFEVYGGILAPPKVFDPNAPPRPKRPLRLPEPEIIRFWVPDGAPDREVELRLVHYPVEPPTSAKGPVILSPGFGTSTLAFSIDTISINLPEYLYEHGYDVWLLDYRASTALPAARTQFTIDDMVTKDYPAAVAEVRRRTGRDVQFVGHCVGSMVFLMSVLAGLKGIRSAVCSQVTLHPTAPRLNKIKARLRLALILEKLGFKDLTTDFDTRARWRDWLFEILLRFYPTSRHCNNPVCRRILFLYGEVFKHDQLNEATHDAIHEMFGVANVRAFKQLSKIVRRGRVVDRHGRDIYLPPIDRLALPIAFIQGEENPIFLPQGTEKTYKLLCEKNGEDLYTYHAIRNYAHMDCFIGKKAWAEAFPIILAELEKHNGRGQVVCVVGRDRPEWHVHLGQMFVRDRRVEVIWDRRRDGHRRPALAHERRRPRPYVENRLASQGWAIVAKESE